MGDFDTITVEKNLDDSVKQLECKIATLQQQLADNLLLIASSGEENSNLQSSLVEKSLLIGTYEEQIQSLNQEITGLTERNKVLRQKREGNKVDIKNLRSERKVLRDLLNKIVGKLQQLVMLAELPPTDTKLIIREEIAEADRGKYKGVFVCCGSGELKLFNQRRFQLLVERLPQFNWGSAPMYVLTDQSKPRFPEGTTLVVFFVRGLSHPEVEAMKRIVKLTGAHLIINSNLGQIIEHIQQWLKNSDFGRIGVSFPLPD